MIAVEEEDEEVAVEEDDEGVDEKDEEHIEEEVEGVGEGDDVGAGVWREGRDEQVLIFITSPRIRF